MKRFCQIYILFLFLFFESAFTQNVGSDDKLDKIGTAFFELNKSILNENNYVDSVVDTNFNSKWDNIIDLNNVDFLFYEIKSQLISDLIQSYYDISNPKQSLMLRIKLKKEIPFELLFNVDIEYSSLKDIKGNEIQFDSFRGVVKGAGKDLKFKSKDFFFDFKDYYEGPIKGKVKFKISFLTSYKIIRVNEFLKDSIFEFQNSKYKVQNFKDGNFSFVGLDSLADRKVKNMCHLNLDKNFNRIIPIESATYVDNLNFDGSFVKNSVSTKITLPEFLLDQKILKMSYDEYLNYIYKNKNSKYRKVHLINYRIKIHNLYIYEECYDAVREFEIDFNQRPNLIEN